MDVEQLLAAALSRDGAAMARDRQARTRDRQAEVSERETGLRDSLECVEHCAAAARDRHAAAHDREQAARDREQAARDRVAANELCQALWQELLIAETDQLTGARTRSAGVKDVAREIDRAHRQGDPLVGVYVDLVGLKIVNDQRSHSAGDSRLRAVVDQFRSHLRTYDVIVRLGGDEFLCVMPNATIHDARERFRGIQHALATGDDPSEIKYGIGQLAEDDDVAAFIQRADADLPVSAPR